MILTGKIEILEEKCVPVPLSRDLRLKLICIMFTRVRVSYHGEYFNAQYMSSWSIILPSPFSDKMDFVVPVYHISGWEY